MSWPRWGGLIAIWIGSIILVAAPVGCSGTSKPSGTGGSGQGGTSHSNLGGGAGNGGNEQGGKGGDGQGGVGGASGTTGAGGAGGSAGGSLSGSAGSVGGAASGGVDAAGSTGGAAGASAGGGDGGSNDVCWPACASSMYGGCRPTGTCTYVTGRYCWSNGFKYAQVDVNGVTEAQFFQDGILCSRSRPTGDGTTYFAPDGTPLGVLVLNADKSDTLTCKGEPPVTVPADCPTFLKGCSYAAGSCQVP